MKIVIFGATGATGRHLVEGALAAGHAVTAFARGPEALGEPRERLTVATGDVKDAEAVRAAIAGHDAVICALGQRKGAPAGDMTIGVENIVRAMEASGVRRLVFLSGYGAGNSKNEAHFVFRRIIRPLFLRDMYAEKDRQEAIISGSALDWIIVRPVRLSDGPAGGGCRVIEGSVSAGPSAEITRADVAAFMLGQLTDDRYLKRTPGIMA
jgi:putative NADH-flavin reductase